MTILLKSRKFDVVLKESQLNISRICMSKFTKIRHHEKSLFQNDEIKSLRKAFISLILKIESTWS